MIIQTGFFRAQKEIRAEMEFYIMTVTTFAMLFALRHREEFWLNSVPHQTTMLSGDLLNNCFR